MKRVNKRPVDHFEGKWEKGKKYTLYAIVKNNGTLFRSLTPKEKAEPYVIYDSTNETFSANAGWEIVELSEDSRMSAGGNISKQDVETALEPYAKSADLSTVATSGSYSDLSNIPTDLVKTSAQTFTEEQKSQARTNLGAASAEEVEALADQKYEGPYDDGELPSASADTMGAIYLVGPDNNDEYERFVTRLSGSTYSWVSLGMTSVNLANYTTKTEHSQLEAKIDGTLSKDVVWTPGYINAYGEVKSSSLSLFSQPFLLKKGEKVTIGTRNTNITIIASTNANSIAVGDTVTTIQRTSNVDRFETYDYVAEEDIKIVLCVLANDYTLSFYDTDNLTDKIDNSATKEELEAVQEELDEDVFGVIQKELSWSQGWINTNGLINPSEASIFTQPFLLKAGESVRVGTNNQNICIIGTTNADSISVSNTITPLQVTTTNAFEEHLFTAETDIKIVICVRESDYTLSFKDADSIDGRITKNTGEISVLKTTATSQGETITKDEINGKLNTFGKTEFGFAIKQGQGLAPATHNYPIEITRGSSVYFIPSYTGGMYSDGQAFFIYLQYKDGTSSSGIRAVEKSNSVVVLKDTIGISVYCSTPASADGQFTLSVILDKNANFGNVKYSVPDYYFANSYLLNKLNRVKSLSEKCIANGNSFVFTTDEHWERNAGNTIALLRYIYDNINIDKYVSGGDSGHLLPNITFGRERKDAFGGKIFPTIGNHEYLSTGTTEQGKYAPPALYNMAAYAYFMYLDNFVGNVERGYYYHDDTFRKIRHITLSAYRQSDEIEYVISGTTYYRVQAILDYGAEQLSWLENDALNVPSGWKIVVVTHTITSYSHDANDLLVPVVDSATKSVCEILLRYNGNGTIVAVFAGHTHRDGLTLLNDSLVGISSDKTDRTIPVIVSTCDAYDFDDVPGEELEGRNLGTITEQAFDIDVLDFTNKEMHCVRIGATADLTYHKSGTLEERIVKYEPVSVSVGSTITLSPGLSGNVSWASQNSGIASVSSSGVVTGVSEGSVLVSAVDDTNHIGYTFIVKVTE